MGQTRTSFSSDSCSNLKYALTMLIQGSPPGTASKYSMVSGVMKAGGESTVKTPMRAGASAKQSRLSVTGVGPLTGGTVFARDDGTVVVGDGGTVVVGDGGTVVVGDGGTVVVGDGGTVVTGDVGTVIMSDGGAVVAGDGG